MSTCWDGPYETECEENAYETEIQRSKLDFYD